MSACESPDPERERARGAQRRSARAARNSLSAAERASASRAITRHVAISHWLLGPRRVGLYVSTAREVDTAGLRTLARQRHCPIYLPRIIHYRARALLFVRECGAALSLNRHGIAEPPLRESLSPRWLSVLFVPVVGFDHIGTRLGSGAGYFDRALAFRRHRRVWHRPVLVGLAYRCQQLPHIERCAHDVPLDAVVTEAGIQWFSGSSPDALAA